MHTPVSFFNIFAILLFLFVIITAKELSLLKFAFSIARTEFTLAPVDHTTTCKTLIFPHLDDSEHAYFENEFGNSVQPRPISLLGSGSLVQPDKDLLFYEKEVSLKHILMELIFGTFRFSRNCVSVFLYGLNLDVSILLSHRWARPHKDYFFFASETAFPVEVNEHARTAPSFRLLRYRHLVVFNQNLSYSMTGSCGPLEGVFSVKCPMSIRGRHFGVVSSDIPSMVRPETNISKAEGTLYTAMEEIGRHYNYTSTIRMSSHGGATGIKINGVWKGNVGDVFARRADFSVGNGITSERHHLVDFGVTHLWFRRVFYIRSPPIKSSWGTIFRPLMFPVWILTGFTVIAVVVVLYGAGRLQAAMRRPLSSGSQPRLLSRIMDRMVRICMEQNASVAPWSSYVMRSVIIFSTMIFLVVSTAYKSKLMNFLAFVEREEIPATHVDLSLSDYQLFFRDYNGISMVETRRSRDPMHKRFMARALLVNDSFKCFRLALTVPRSACMDYIVSGTYTTATNMSLMTDYARDIFIRSNDIDIKWGMMWTFAKGSPLTATFDRIKGQVLAAGLFEKWMEADWYKKKRDGVHWLREQTHSKIKKTIQDVLNDLSRGGAMPLGLANLLDIFTIVGLGLGCSLLFWIGENVQRYSIGRLALTWRLHQRLVSYCT